MSHLLAHSWAKATLFLAVGVCLHGVLVQDLRSLSLGIVMMVSGIMSCAAL